MMRLCVLIVRNHIILLYSTFTLYKYLHLNVKAEKKKDGRKLYNDSS